MAYVGSRGRNLLAARDINQPAPSPRRRTCGRTRDSPTSRSSSRAPARSYDSLQVRFTQRLDARLAVLAAYTLGKSDRRRLQLLRERGRRELPAGQQQPRRARAVQLRRPAPVLPGGLVRSCRSGRAAGGCTTDGSRPLSWVAGALRAWRRSRAAARSPSRFCPRSTTATRAGPASASAPTIGPIRSAIPRCRPAGRAHGSMRRRLPSRRSAASATSGATRSRDPGSRT